MKKKKKRKFLPRNAILGLIAHSDPARLKIRVVKPETGKGKKGRPRQKTWSPHDRVHEATLRALGHGDCIKSYTYTTPARAA